MFGERRIAIDGRQLRLTWPADDRDCFPSIEWEWHHSFKRHIANVTNKRAAICAGGNCGLYPLYLSQMFETVYTFEPDPINFYCLASNCTSNKIVKFNACVGSKPQFVNIGKPWAVNAGMVRVDAGNIPVYTMTIDSLKIPELDFLLLDVEGLEYDVIKGAWKTLSKYKPTIIIELSERHDDVVGLLSKLGYRIVEDLGNLNYLMKVYA